MRTVWLKPWLFVLLMLATQAQNSSQNAPLAKSPSSASQAAATHPTASDIAAAKAAGKVWVNLDSGSYHKSGRWYGKTKNGKFMTEADAKAAGYAPARRE